VKITDKRIRDIIKQEIINKESKISEKRDAGRQWRGRHATAEERAQMTGAERSRYERERANLPRGGGIDTLGGEDIEGHRRRMSRYRGTRRRASNISEIQLALGVAVTGELDQETKSALIDQITAGYETYGVAGMPDLDDVIGDGASRPAQWSENRPYAAMRLGYEAEMRRSPETAMVAFISNGFGPSPTGNPPLFSRWLKAKVSSLGGVSPDGVIEIRGAGDSVLYAILGSSDNMWDVYVASMPSDPSSVGKLVGAIELDEERTTNWVAETEVPREVLREMIQRRVDRVIVEQSQDEEMNIASGGNVMDADQEQALRDLIATGMPEEDARKNLSMPSASPTIVGGGATAATPVIPPATSGQASAAAASLLGGGSTSAAGAGGASVTDEMRPAYLTYIDIIGNASEQWTSPAADQFAIDIGYTGAVGSAKTIEKASAQVAGIADGVVEELERNISKVIREYQPLVDAFDAYLDGITTDAHITDMVRKTLGLVMEDNDVLSNCRLVNGMYARESWSAWEIGLTTVAATVITAAALAALPAVAAVGGVAAPAIALPGPAAIGLGGAAGTVTMAGAVPGGLAATALIGPGAMAMWPAGTVASLVAGGGTGLLTTAIGIRLADFGKTEEAAVFKASSQNELASDISMQFKFTGMFSATSHRKKAIRDALQEFWREIADDAKAFQKGEISKFKKADAIRILQTNLGKEIGYDVTPCAPNGGRCTDLDLGLEDDDEPEVQNESVRKRVLRSAIRTAMLREGLLDDNWRAGDGSSAPRSEPTSSSPAETRPAAEAQPQRGSRDMGTGPGVGGAHVYDVERLLGMGELADTTWDEDTWSKWSSFVEPRMRSTGFEPTYIGRISNNWQGLSGGPPGYEAAGIQHQVHYSNDARGALAFLTRLIADAGEGGQRTASGNLPNRMGWVARSASEAAAVSTAQLGQVGLLVATAADGRGDKSGTVTVWITGAGTVKMAASPGSIIPRSPKRGALRRAIKKLNIAPDVHVTIDLTDRRRR